MVVSGKAAFLMTFREKPLRVALLGVRGIGQVHARIFHALGAEICAVLGSSQESAAGGARILKESFGIHAEPFSRIESLLDTARPNAMSICTPPQLHFAEIVAAFDRDIPVFCEKPMFWHEGIKRSELETNLEYLSRHPNRRFFINTSNATFMDCVIEEIGEQENIQSLFFLFYTQGPYVGRNIARDLLPHGISLLLRLFSPMKIEDLREDIKKHTYGCRFRYGNCTVEFDFRELADGPKEFAFEINDRRFTRIQEGEGPTYRVYLKDSHTGRKIDTPNPFCVYITRFLNYCNDGARVREDDFENAAANLRLMADILLAGS